MKNSDLSATSRYGPRRDATRGTVGVPPGGDMEARRQLILEWQRPIYSYVYRMLRNEAEAADATQEVFVRALANLGSFRTESFKPWIYRVATNTAYKRHRDSKLRVEKEREAGMIDSSRNVADQNQELEHREREEIVQRQIAALPRESRSLLILHYYNDLSQREIADVLEIPRTTVADRLRKSLTLLKGRLRDSGHLALVPQIDSILAGGGLVAVPPSLSHSLLGLAGGSSGTAAGVSTGILIGGITMSKSLVVTTVIVVAASVMLGFGLGKVISGGGGKEEALAARQELQDAEDRYAELHQDFDRLSRKFTALDGQNRELAAALEKERAARAAAESGVTKPAVAALRESDPRIDWDQIAQMIEENADVVARLGHIVRTRGEITSLSPEDQAAYHSLLLEWNKAAALARLETPYPILDEEILPDLVSAFFQGTLGLDDSQTSALARDSLEALARFPIDDDATPLEAYQARLEVLGQVTGNLPSLLTAAQKENWSDVTPVWMALCHGNRSEYAIGIQNQSWTGERLTQLLQDHYRLTSDQVGDLGQMQKSYLAQARKLLERHGQLGDNRVELDAGARRALDSEFYALQLAMERGLLPLLSADQRADLQSQHPLLLRFEDGGNLNISTEENMGF